MRSVLLFIIFLGSCISAMWAQNTVIIRNDKLKVPIEYELKPLPYLNTEQSEFGAVPYENGILYASEQAKDLINFENTDPGGLPYLNIYFSVMNAKVMGKKKKFSRQINSSFHDGPVALNEAQNKLFLSRVTYTSSSNKEFVNRSKIYMYEKNGTKWSKPTSFKYNSDSYSVGHVSLSHDGLFMFFTSDMPGGLGGKDIYVCKWNGVDWDAPQNLGSDVNSAANELFPFIRKDGLLFFSSDRQFGFGGLDIYSAVKADKWQLRRNEGPGINSAGDDFSVYFISETNGYVSSNREGGKGNDDLYSFVYTNKYINLEGYVLNSRSMADVSGLAKLVLKDSTGSIIAYTKTSKNGYFKFSDLEPDKIYYLKLDETDADYNGKKRFYYADKDSNIVRVSVEGTSDKFIFRNLPSEENGMPQLESESDITIAGNLFHSENPSVPIANTKLVLKDEDGTIVSESTTNKFGAFVFAHLPPGSTYYVEILEGDAGLPPNTKITLTNKDGKTIKTILSDSNSKFAFKILASDKSELKELAVEDKELLLDFKARLCDPLKKPLSNIIVYLKNQDGKIIAIDTTDATGAFNFRRLPVSNNYLVTIDEEDGTLKQFNKLFIMAPDGKLVREIRRIRGGFAYHVLQGDASSFTNLYVDDPWLTVLDFNKDQKKREITIEEKVYYALAEYRINNESKKVLDKVVKVMLENPDISIELGSHTDSRADDKFNLKLSEKRAKAAVEYIVSHGVDKRRLKAIGFGETKLKNNCSNTITCSEEEHAINRRTEFRVLVTTGQ